MNKHALYISLLVWGGMVGTAHAQQESLRTHLFDNHYWANPAAAGATDYHQLRMNYRLQWANMPGSPQTALFSYNGAFRRVGIGARVEYDAIASFKRVQAEVAYSYHIPITQKIRLSLGLSGKYGNYRLVDRDNLGLVNVNDAAINANSAVSNSGDMGAGIYFYMGNLFAGISATNLIQSRTKFSNDNAVSAAKLYRQFEAMAGYKFSFKEGKTTLMPSAYFRMVQGASPQVDINLRLGLLNEQLVTGFTYRTTMDFAFFAGFRFDKKFLLMYSYEFTGSTLQKFTAGSHEITIGVDIAAQKEKPKKETPDQTGNGKL